MKKILLFGLLLGIIFCSYAQDKKFVDSLQHVYNTSKDDTIRILALGSIAQEYRNSKPDTCMTLSQKVLEMSEAINFVEGRGYAYMGIGTANLVKYKYPDALIAYEKALVCFEKTKSKQNIGTCIFNIGLVYDYQANYTLALEYYLKSLKIREEMKDKAAIAISSNSLGTVYQKQGNYPLALEYFHRSLKIREEIGAKQSVVVPLHNIANIYKFQKNYELALEYQQKCLKINEEVDNKSRVALNLNNMGLIYFEQKKYILALEYYQKSLKISEAIGDKKNESHTLNNIGDSYSQQGELEKAIAFYEKSLKIKEEIDYKWAIPYTQNGLAKIYQQKGEYDKSIAYAQKGIEITQAIKAAVETSFLSETLYKTYKLKGDYAKALEYYELHKTINDSLFDTEKNKAIANLEAKAEIERKAREIELLSKNQELLAKDKSLLEQSNLLLEKNNQLQRIVIEKEKSAKLAISKQAEADRFFALARQEKDKHKQDSLLLIAQKTQFEAEKLSIENQTKDLEAQQAVEHQRFLTTIIWLVAVSLLGALASLFWIIRNRQQLKKMNTQLSLANQDIRVKNTAINQQKEEIQTQAEQLSIANKTKDKLFSIIGHDLRSPVASLMGLLDLVADDDISQEEFKALAPDLQRNVKNMHNTLENLLQWSKTQMDGIDANPQELVIQELVQEHFALFEVIANNKTIQLLASFQHSQQPYADENHIRLLLRNLIGNALKFTPEGGSITVSSQDVLQGTMPMLKVSITDTGVGMSAENASKLFGKGQTFTTYGTAGEKGTGLGLLLCKEMIEKNGGEIGVESLQGKGTTFWFTLPLFLGTKSF